VVKKAEAQRISGAPERIWLQVGDDVTTASDMAEVDFREASWCAEQIFDTDVEYVRIDHCKGAKPTP
jgi:hypothetical protein